MAPSHSSSFFISPSVWAHEHLLWINTKNNTGIWMNAFGFAATRGQSRGVRKEDRDQAKVQVLAGMLRWTTVLILLVMQQKRSFALRHPPLHYHLARKRWRAERRQGNSIEMMQLLTSQKVKSPMPNSPGTKPDVCWVYFKNCSRWNLKAMQTVLN